MSTDFSASGATVSVSNGQAEILIALWQRELLGLEAEAPIAGSTAGDLIELLHQQLFHAGMGCQGFAFDAGPLARLDARALFADAVHAVAREIRRQLEDHPRPLPCPAYAFLAAIDPLQRDRWLDLVRALDELARGTIPGSYARKPSPTIGPAAVLRYGQEVRLLRRGTLTPFRAGMRQLLDEGRSDALRASFCGAEWGDELDQAVHELVRNELVNHGPDRLGLGAWLEISRFPSLEDVAVPLLDGVRDERVVANADYRRALAATKLDEELARPALVHFARQAFALRAEGEDDEQVEDITEDSYLTGEARAWVGEVLHRWRAQLAAERDGLLRRLAQHPDDAPLLLWEARLF